VTVSIPKEQFFEDTGTYSMIISFLGTEWTGEFDYQGSGRNVVHLTSNQTVTTPEQPTPTPTPEETSTPEPTETETPVQTETPAETPGREVRKGPEGHRDSGRSPP